MYIQHMYVITSLLCVTEYQAVKETINMSHTSFRDVFKEHNERPWSAAGVEPAARGAEEHGEHVGHGALCSHHYIRGMTEFELALWALNPLVATSLGGGAELSVHLVC